MIAKDLQYVRKLHLKKYRCIYGVFVVETWKVIEGFLESPYTLSMLYYVDTFPELEHISSSKRRQITAKQLKQMSQLKTPNNCLALFSKPKDTDFNILMLRGKNTLVLENIQDPGNLGTIIRTAVWFGWNTLIMSKNTVEIYNSKCVQATMGALAKIHCIYTNIQEVLQEAKRIGIPSFGASLEGENIYEKVFASENILVLGNEAKGISKTLYTHIDNRITIPRKGNIESLNVSIAAAICLSEISK